MKLSDLKLLRNIDPHTEEWFVLSPKMYKVILLDKNNKGVKECLK